MPQELLPQSQPLALIFSLLVRQILFLIQCFGYWVERCSRPTSSCGS